MAEMPLAEDQAGRLKPLEPKRKGDAAYHAIRRSILLGHIKPGGALTEQRIASELACSQGTVREAMFKLEQDGLVQRRGYRGTVVLETSVQEALQMVKVRVALESAAFEAVARDFPSELQKELEAIIGEMAGAIQTRDHYLCSELDRKYHLTIMRGSGLLALDPILNRCTLHIHRFTYDDADLGAPDVRFAERHRELLDAVTSGDPEFAVASIRRHIEDVLLTWAPELVSSA